MYLAFFTIQNAYVIISNIVHILFDVRDAADAMPLDRGVL